MSERIDRTAIIDALKRASLDSGYVRAAWLGGSDATGRLDAWSDIDWCCIADDERLEDAVGLVRTTLAALSPIEIEWRLPSPTWHGHEQIFVRLRDAGPHLMIDSVVMKKSSTPQSRLLETERHGNARVLFDPEGLIVPPPFDRAAHAAKMKARLEQTRLKFPLLQTIVIRAIERGQPCDAAYFYMQLTLVPTVEVLRMLHCPDRFDYGMRYLRDDLPREVYDRICAAALPGSLDQLRAAQKQCEGMFADALARLDVTSGFAGPGKT